MILYPPKNLFYSSILGYKRRNEVQKNKLWKIENRFFSLKEIFSDEKGKKFWVP